MAMRELVTGGAACAVPGAPSSSSSNPFGALANALIGSSSKTHEERLREIPTSTIPNSDSRFLSNERPGLSELDQPQFMHPNNGQGSEFLHGFRLAEHAGHADAWDEIYNSQLPHIHGGPTQTYFPNQVVDARLQPTLDGPPQRMLSSFLHSFLDSSRTGIPLRPAPLPLLGLSEGDKKCIRDRSSIMARHVFVDKGEEFINSQVNALMHSLENDNDIRSMGSLPGRYRELEGYWNESQGTVVPAPHAVDGWAEEYSQHRADGNPDSWVCSFEHQHGADGWASEFQHEQTQMASMNRMRGANISNLAHTLAQNNDPKFQLHVPERWANEFVNDNEQRGLTDDKWVNEFSKLHLQEDWADEFRNQVAEGTLGDDVTENWASAYDEYVNEQVVAKELSGSSRSVYVFSDMNPYVGHPNPLKEGQDLFHKGLLSEAVLALEAEVLKNPDNAEGWRLLGISHAENDDDQQAIASMMRAHEVDPTNLEVLLALGVSHTNELEQPAALKHLFNWLRHHPKYSSLAPPEISVSLYADVARLFNEAAQISPEDADVHVLLGVLYNLSREFDKAIGSFQTALKLKPNDYSLWNKLGATQANSVQSAEAISAYQQALDLKPNYVRAWANMAIGYSNQGMHEESIRYYVCALMMNPKADNAWQYLRFSLSCASRNDMIEACDSRNLDALQKEFPL